MTDTTRIAVLGTLAEFHEYAIPYDIQALIDLVAEVHPDLLCLDISPERWQRREFATLPVEYREALLPLAEQSDIVVVPIGQDEQVGAVDSGARQWLISWLRNRLAQLQRSAAGLDPINRGWRHDLGNLIYYMIIVISAGDTREQHDKHLAGLKDRVVETIQRDPETRILVVVNIQYCHLLRPMLRKHKCAKVVSYHNL